MFLNRVVFLLSVSLSLGFSDPLLAKSDALSSEQVLEVLRASDRSRGGGLPGVEWTLEMKTVEPRRDDYREILSIEAIDNYSLATTVFPPRNADQKLLQVKKNMWFSKPNLRKPESISPRQKITGPAANGDIAATNYALDYDAEYVKTEEFSGREAYVLELTGKSKWVTYDRIRYWVDAESNTPLRAEFYTVSGKMFKYAIFKSDNSIEYEGQTIPFISEMQIHDAVRLGAKSTLSYSDVRIRDLNYLDFSPSKMMD